MTGISGWYRLHIFATSRLPCACSNQWRSIPKALGSSWCIIFSASKLSLPSILAAKLIILTFIPFLSRCSKIETNPIGYISNMGVEGTPSAIGPYIMACFLKSYTVGAWSKIKCGLRLAILIFIVLFVFV